MPLLANRGAGDMIRLLTEDPYSYDGAAFSMPERSVLPRPWTPPHPPLWLACGSPATFEKAGRLGMGALCFTMGEPEDLAPLIETYRTAIRAWGVDGFKLDFIPASDDILHHTKLLDRGETAVLEFTAPATPGDYEYVCTFPGHFLLMRGVLKVE